MADGYPELRRALAPKRMFEMNRISTNQKIVFLLLALIFITLIVFLSSKGSWVRAGGFVSLNKTPNVSNYYEELLRVLETNVTSNPNDEARKIEEERIKTLRREATQVAAGLSAQALGGYPTPVPTRYINATLQALEVKTQEQWGLIDNPSVPMSSAVFRAENAWKQDLGDGYMLIIAGCSPTDTSKGILHVSIHRKGYTTSRTFLVPGEKGSIRIIEAAGTRLVLEAANKETLYFDMPGLSFVDTLQEVVPTSALLMSDDKSAPSETPLSPYP